MAKTFDDLIGDAAKKKAKAKADAEAKAKADAEAEAKAKADAEAKAKADAEAGAKNTSKPWNDKPKAPETPNAAKKPLVPEAQAFPDNTKKITEDKKDEQKSKDLKGAALLERLKHLQDLEKDFLAHERSMGRTHSTMRVSGGKVKIKNRHYGYTNSGKNPYASQIKEVLNQLSGGGSGSGTGTGSEKPKGPTDMSQDEWVAHKMDGRDSSDPGYKEDKFRAGLEWRNADRKRRADEANQKFVETRQKEREARREKQRQMKERQDAAYQNKLKEDGVAGINRDDKVYSVGSDGKAYKFNMTQRELEERVKGVLAEAKRDAANRAGSAGYNPTVKVDFGTYKETPDISKAPEGKSGFALTEEQEAALPKKTEFSKSYHAQTMGTQDAGDNKFSITTTTEDLTKTVTNPDGSSGPAKSTSTETHVTNPDKHRIMEFKQDNPYEEHIDDLADRLVTSHDWTPPGHYDTEHNSDEGMFKKDLEDQKREEHQANALPW